MLDLWSEMCARHRVETLAYLAMKTAAVRCGAKPGELLRVPLCGRQGAGGCERIRTVFAQLALPYRVLSESGDGALTLFYHPARLAEALSRPGAVAVLTARGWPVGHGCEALLGELARRWRRAPAHEVGFFIGYPCKDVAGFLSSAPEVTRPGDRWRVFVEEGPSRLLMRFHRRIEFWAAGVCATAPGRTACFRRLAAFPYAFRYHQIMKGA